MAQEEKIKRYDEALERAKKLQETCDSQAVVGWCEYLFPELKESRPNGCIVLEDFNGGEGFYKLNLDYLNEKQVEEIEEMVRTWNKESKTSNENIKNCIGMCLTDVNEQRFKDYNTNLRDCLAWLEKQGEQKQYDIDVLEKHITKDSISELAHTVIVRNGWEIVDAKEQNPAWSEEDELHIRELESLVKKAWAIVEHENDKDTIHKMSDLSFFLKTLKPQLKREWGEEDETELINTIIMLKEGASLHFNKKDITKAVNWLKSLIPQSKQKWTLETI